MADRKYKNCKMIEIDGHVSYQDIVELFLDKIADTKIGKSFFKDLQKVGKGKKVVIRYNSKLGNSCAAWSVTFSAPSRAIANRRRHRWPIWRTCVSIRRPRRKPTTGRRTARRA